MQFEQRETIRTSIDEPVDCHDDGVHASDGYSNAGNWLDAEFDGLEDTLAAKKLTSPQ
jgi:hypothetical protein